MAITDRSIAIIGCGWLGLPLTQMFLANQYRVIGSTTSTSKLAQLSSLGIEACLINIYESDRDLRIDPVKIVVINIPPGRHVEKVASQYPDGISRLLSSNPWMKEALVIYVSSTGVYANSGMLTDETSALDPQRPSGVAIKRTEEIIQELLDNYIILRMSGLAGPGREPGRWFAGKSNLPGGDTPVNMVHLDDCLAIIKAVVDQPLSHKIYNVSAPLHPSKRAFYTRQADKLGLSVPRFEDGIVPHKVISPQLLMDDLGYQYIHPSPLDF